VVLEEWRKQLRSELVRALGVAELGRTKEGELEWPEEDAEVNLLFNSTLFHRV
jgi:hypothetical protein